MSLDLTPRQIVDALDAFIVGQPAAKRAVGASSSTLSSARRSRPRTSS